MRVAAAFQLTSYLISLWKKGDFRYLVIMDFQVVIAQDPPDLGNLIKERLFAYIERHPDGVIALPTGKTPETLIEALKSSKARPNTKRLRFVQLDEYFPIQPNDPKSFCRYVHDNYLGPLKISSENALTMEGLIGPTLQLHGIEATFSKGPWRTAAIEEGGAFCRGYEQRIRAWGGIGFFLGGIGPDGHIAFNKSGSPFDSETRIVDLGGRLAATIGLKTICRSHPDVEAILFASGESKSAIVAEAIKGPISTAVPATALRTLRKSWFYLTRDAARVLRS